MPSYTVDLAGGGQMTVNASSPQAAQENVRAQGGTPSGSSGSSPSSSTSSSSSGGAGTFTTVNGPKTQSQMFSELMAVGYNGPTDDASVQAAYARTTGGAVGGTQNTTGAQPAGFPASTVPQTNLDAFNSALQQASAAAQQAYLQGKLRLDTDELAFRKAQQAFAESISRANLTGTFEGQQTQAAQKQAADLLGTYQGQPTLAALKQQADLAAQQAGLTGLFNNQTTLAAQNQYFNQGLAEQTLQQKTVQDYLTLLSGLRGPQDYGQYLRTLASTPQGLQSLVGAAAGNQGRVPSFGTTGAPTQAATLGGFMGQAAGGQTPTGGPASTSYADYQAAARGLPPPSQIAPQNWNAMTEAQKQLLMGMYESNGWNVTDAMQQYKASLPTFGGASGNVRLV